MRVELLDSLRERFEAKRGRGDTNECWEWEGGSWHPFGYGMIHAKVDGQWRKFTAHRIAIALKSGLLPPADLVVAHHCDNPACTNPSHLYVGTQKENVADMDRRGRRHVVAPGCPGEDNPNAKLLAAEVVAIRGRYIAGARQAELAAEFGVSQSTISRVVRGSNWGPDGAFHGKPRAGRGERVRTAKLTESDVREVRDEHARGASCAALGRRFGVGRGTILKVVKRRTWAHVD